MHILYVAVTCTESTYRQILEKSEVKTLFQAQKYHRLLIEGLSSHADVDVIAHLPTTAADLEGDSLTRPAERAGRVRYQYTTFYRKNAVRYPMQLTQMLCLIRSAMRKDSVIVTDCMNVAASFAAVIASKLFRIPCIGILTDLPEFIWSNSVGIRLVYKIIRSCDGYVLLAEAMKDRLRGNKPYIVMEGHADASMAALQPSLAMKEKPRVCMYAGTIEKQYGLETLVQGFLKAQLPDTVLKIYGPGGYVDELKQIAEKNPNVVYGGMLFSEEVVQKEREATLLINPRPAVEEFVKYSFPSKTMEYMSTGTPVLMAQLPSIPKEYLPHLNLFSDITQDAVAEGLKSVLSRSDAELLAQGCAAREFVLGDRNNRVQAKRLIQMAQKICRNGGAKCE